MDHLPNLSLLSGNLLEQRELIDVGHDEFYQGCLSRDGGAYFEVGGGLKRAPEARVGRGGLGASSPIKF